MTPQQRKAVARILDEVPPGTGGMQWTPPAPQLRTPGPTPPAPFSAPSLFEDKLFQKVRDRHLRSYTTATPFHARFDVDRPSRDPSKMPLACWDAPLSLWKCRWPIRDASSR